MGEYEAVHAVDKADWKILDIPRLLEVLEPALMAYYIGGFRFKREEGYVSCRFEISHIADKYKNIAPFTICVANRNERRLSPNDPEIFSIGYKRFRVGGYTHQVNCNSYDSIPAWFCKAIELWKQGE
jgi:hypothetical protein